MSQRPFCFFPQIWTLEIRLATKCMANVGLGITCCKRAREINQLAVSFGCIMVVAQPHNPKTAQLLGRFRVQFPGCTVVQQNQLFWFLWVNAAETPIHAS